MDIVDEIGVHHVDVHYALHSAGPAALKEDVSMVILFHWLVVAGLVGWTSFYFFSSTTTDQGFVAYCLRGKGFSSQLD
jgi:hypothetical protein